MKGFNKMKFSVQQNINMNPLTSSVMGSGRDEVDNVELTRQAERLDLVKGRMKAMRDSSSKHCNLLHTEANAYKAHSKAIDGIPTSGEKGPMSVILQRICEFSNLTSANTALLQESIQSSLSDPCENFIKTEIHDARKKKDAYDKARSDYHLALERNKNADSALKKASQKDKMYFQDKLKESGAALDEAQDRYETLSREAEFLLSWTCDIGNVLSVGWLLSFLKSYVEFHENCLSYLKILMTSETMNKWEAFVQEETENIEKKKQAGAGPSKKVFGNTLLGLCQWDQEQNSTDEIIPTPILRMITHLNEHCLEVEGIFRLSGNLNDLEMIRRKIDAGENPDFGSGTDAHLVSGLLKKYLRDLPEPLLTFELFDDFLACHTLPDAQKATALNKVMKKLPEVNRSVFHAISILCYNVMCHSDVNKMTANNLGIVFAPSCLYSQSNDPSALEKSLDANALVSYIFQNIDVVFEGFTSSVPKETSKPPSTPASSASAASAASAASSSAPTAAPSSSRPPPADAPPAPPPLSSEWTEHTTDDGHTYWYNSQTSVSTWYNPFESTVKPATSSQKGSYRASMRLPVTPSGGLGGSGGAGGTGGGGGGGGVSGGVTRSGRSATVTDPSPRFDASPGLAGSAGSVSGGGVSGGGVGGGVGGGGGAGGVGPRPVLPPKSQQKQPPPGARPVLPARPAGRGGKGPPPRRVGPPPVTQPPYT